MTAPGGPERLPDPNYPSFYAAFLYWLKLGFISFGGPAGQIAIMHQELVEKRRWISERRFLHALNYCMLLPGPEAQQLAIYMGWLLHRTPGGIVAGTLFVLPSLFILAGLSYAYLAYGELALVQGIFNGIKPAVLAIVLFAAWRIGKRALKNRLLWTIAAASFVAIFILKLPFPAIILAAGIAGFIGGKLAPEKFALGGESAGAASDGAALIDDDTPAPAHAKFDARACVKLIARALLLWATAILTLQQPVLRDLGLFFTQAALVTFGGAYAVLPYVAQASIDHYHWLTAAQMIDGLALGETTPGPLIMIVAFVGFVGAWTHEIFGPQALALAGCAGACVATFFTFLPSFVFILAGAPFIEATHGDLKFTAPLSAITAAVVGVILNLGVFFGWHVLWPQATPESPFAGSFELVNALVALAAFLALSKYQRGVIEVIAACALVGVVARYTV
jgi:chromate transporter